MDEISFSLIVSAAFEPVVHWLYGCLLRNKITILLFEIVFQEVIDPLADTEPD